MLEIKGVSASYGSVPAISNVSIEIGEGEAVGLLGANGAGKSTTLRAISGLVKRSSGSVRFAGTDLASLPAYRIPELGIAHARRADILVAAVGRAGVVTKDMVKPGAAVIDVGMNRIDDPSAERGSRLVGDVDPAVAEVAGWLTPVPGGVGPMTIAMLLDNTLKAARRAAVGEAEPSR